MSGPSASCSNVDACAPRPPSRRGPNSESSFAATGMKLSAFTKCKRTRSPTCRWSRSASSKLAVASPTRVGSARRPSSIFQRSMSVPSRVSRAATGKRSLGPTRRSSLIRPVNRSGTEARALSATSGQLLDVVEVDGSDEPEVAATAQEHVAGVLRPRERGVRRIGPARTGEQRQHDRGTETREHGEGEPGPPARPRLGAQPEEHGRHVGDLTRRPAPPPGRARPRSPTAPCGAPRRAARSGSRRSSRARCRRGRSDAGSRSRRGGCRARCASITRPSPSSSKKKQPYTWLRNCSLGIGSPGRSVAIDDSPYA